MKGDYHFRRNPLPKARQNQADTKNYSEPADAIGSLDEPTRSIPGQPSKAKEHATGVSR
jgi:hypothetical protein